MVLLCQKTKRTRLSNPKLPPKRYKLARDDIIWEYHYQHDFGSVSFLTSVKESWIEKYQECSETPQWDPVLSDTALTISDNNRTATRSNQGLFCKAISMHPINTRRSRVIQLESNNRFYMGFFAAPSKKALHESVCKLERDMMELLSSHRGRITLLTLYGTQLHLKKEIEPLVEDDGTPAWERDDKDDGVERSVLPYQVPYKDRVKMKLHIHAERQSVTWEVNDDVLVESPLPYPPPVFLIYQTGDPKTVISITGSTNPERL